MKAKRGMLSGVGQNSSSTLNLPSKIDRVRPKSVNKPVKSIYSSLNLQNPSFIQALKQVMPFISSVTSKKDLHFYKSIDFGKLTPSSNFE